MTMTFQVVCAVILLGHIEPFETRFQQRLEMVNEICLMFVIYPIICFSPFVPSPERKQEMGYIICTFIVFNLAINLYFMLSGTAY
jgi:hypothetical protein